MGGLVAQLRLCCCLGQMTNLFSVLRKGKSERSLKARAHLQCGSAEINAGQKRLQRARQYRLTTVRAKFLAYEHVIAFTRKSYEFSLPQVKKGEAFISDRQVLPSLTLYTTKPTERHGLFGQEFTKATSLPRLFVSTLKYLQTSLW